MAKYTITTTHTYKLQKQFLLEQCNNDYLFQQTLWWYGHVAKLHREVQLPKNVGKIGDSLQQFAEKEK